MTTHISDFVSVADHAAKLGCAAPTGVAVLPQNFGATNTREDLLFGSEAATMRKVFRNNNFPLDEFLPAGERVASIHNKHFEWAPVLFISGALLTNNPHAVSVALGIVSNYATDFFKGLPRKRVKLTLVVERKRDRVCKKLEYEGDIEGLSSLAEVVRRIGDE